MPNYRSSESAHMALPASAILASTLLQKSRRGQSNGILDAPDARHVDGSSWDLMRDIDLGVPSAPDCTILSCGRVVGVSGLSSADDLTHGNNERDVRGWVGEVRWVLLFLKRLPWWNIYHNGNLQSATRSGRHIACAITTFLLLVPFFIIMFYHR